MPPLRERRDDIAGIAEATLRRVDPGRSWQLSLPLRRLLVSPALVWPGNVRQLERVIERARERAVTRDPEGHVLLPDHLDAVDLGQPIADVAPVAVQDAQGDLGSEWQRLQGERAKLDELEERVLREALKKAGGVVAQAARELGIARTTLSSRVDALGMRAPRKDGGAKD
jgi:transcriptional regulator with GAF, ATPase, and Fis domain